MIITTIIGVAIAYTIERGGKEMFRNKYIIVIFSILMLFALAGCKAKETTTTPAPSGGQKDGETAAPEEDLSPVTFTYFNAASPKQDAETKDTKIGKIFEEQTGVNFKMEHIVGDINTKLGVMIASGEYPDVLVPDIAIDKILDAEAFIPLTDLIEEHGPKY